MKQIIIFLFLALVPISEVFCGNVYLKTEKEEIFISPKGKKIGEINSSAPIKVLEEMADLLKIQVIGWVHRDAVDLEMKSVPDSILEPVSFKKKIVDGGYDIYMHRFKKNVLFNVKFKNNGKNTITDWEGILFFKDIADKILFSAKFISSSNNIEPGKTQVLNIEIAEEQVENIEDFVALKILKKKKLKLTLKDVRIKTKPSVEKKSP